MARVARAIRCELGVEKPGVFRRESVSPVQVIPAQRVKASTEGENGKIVLQPRLFTVRSYGENRFGVVKTKRDGGDEVSPFFETLSEYIESSKKSHDFEIISGRLAMHTRSQIIVDLVKGSKEPEEVMGSHFERTADCVSASGLVIQFKRQLKTL